MPKDEKARRKVKEVMAALTELAARVETLERVFATPTITDVTWTGPVGTIETGPLAPVLEGDDA